MRKRCRKHENTELAKQGKNNQKKGNSTSPRTRDKDKEMELSPIILWHAELGLRSSEILDLEIRAKIVEKERTPH